MDTGHTASERARAVHATTRAGFILAFLIPPVGIIVSTLAKRRAERSGIDSGLAVYGRMVGITLTAIPALVIAIELIMIGVKDL
jgi:hypothetical protein